MNKAFWILKEILFTSDICTPLSSKYFSIQSDSDLHSQKCDGLVLWESALGSEVSTDKVNWLSTQSMQEVDVH